MINNHPVAGGIEVTCKRLRIRQWHEGTDRRLCWYTSLTKALECLKALGRPRGVRRETGHGVHICLASNRDPELTALGQRLDQIKIAVNERGMRLDDEYVRRSGLHFL